MCLIGMFLQTSRLPEPIGSHGVLERLGQTTLLSKLCQTTLLSISSPNSTTGLDAGRMPEIRPPETMAIRSQV